MKYLAISVLAVIGIFLALMTIPMIWSGHFGEFRTPEEYFEQVFKVPVPPEAKLIKDQRGTETLLIWQCTSAEILAIEMGPPKGYFFSLWKPWNLDCAGAFVPKLNEWGNYFYIQDANSARTLILDKRNSQLIGSH
jgi:hypothetical protein